MNEWSTYEDTHVISSSLFPSTSCHLLSGSLTDSKFLKFPLLVILFFSSWPSTDRMKISHLESRSIKQAQSEHYCLWQSALISLTFNLFLSVSLIRVSSHAHELALQCYGAHRLLYTITNQTICMYRDEVCVLEGDLGLCRPWNWLIFM